MNVEYNDGRREMLTGLTPDQVDEHAKRVTTDPAFKGLEVLSEKEIEYLTNGENNRHGRRKLAAQLRRKGKR